jgi:hypothetical protein
MQEKWFQHKNVTRLDIYSHKIHQDKMVPDLVIKDVKTIRSLMDRIEQLPADGDQMKSFDMDTEEIDLCFYNDAGCQQIEIYRGKFKTPSTGFNSNANELETKLYTDIAALLFPANNKLLLKIEGLELQFKNFSITYSGSEFRDMAPATVSFTTDKFICKDKNNEQQLFEIISGQLPPKSLDIEVNDFKFKIVTYQTEDQQKLYPNYFQIVPIS